MYQIFIGSLVLSLIHALIPNHWIPLIAISKTEKWTQRQALWATAITGFSHTFSTIIIGIVVGVIGYKLSSSYELISTVAAPILWLVWVSFIYFSISEVIIITVMQTVMNTHDHIHPEQANQNGMQF